MKFIGALASAYRRRDIFFQNLGFSFESFVNPCGESDQLIVQLNFAKNG